MDQIERITYMESILDRCVKALSEHPAQRRALDEPLRELAAYYTSPLWLQDLDDDCAGKLPTTLKRGVLSEDAIYDLLSEWNIPL